MDNGTAETARGRGPGEPACLTPTPGDLSRPPVGDLAALADPSPAAAAAAAAEGFCLGAALSLPSSSACCCGEGSSDPTRGGSTLVPNTMRGGPVLLRDRGLAGGCSVACGLRFVPGGLLSVCGGFAARCGDLGLVGGVLELDPDARAAAADLAAAER